MEARLAIIPGGDTVVYLFIFFIYLLPLTVSLFIFLRRDRPKLRVLQERRRQATVYLCNPHQAGEWEIN